MSKNKKEREDILNVQYICVHKIECLSDTCKTPVYGSIRVNITHRIRIFSKYELLYVRFPGLDPLHDPCVITDIFLF